MGSSCKSFCANSNIFEAHSALEDMCAKCLLLSFFYTPLRPCNFFQSENCLVPQTTWFQVLDTTSWKSSCLIHILKNLNGMFLLPTSPKSDTMQDEWSKRQLDVKNVSLTSNLFTHFQHQRSNSISIFVLKS